MYMFSFWCWSSEQSSVKLVTSKMLALFIYKFGIIFCVARDFAEITCQSKPCRGQHSDVLLLAGLFMNLNDLNGAGSLCMANTILNTHMFSSPKQRYHEHVCRFQCLAWRAQWQQLLKEIDSNQAAIAAGDSQLFCRWLASIDGCVREISDTYSYALKSATGMRIRSKYVCSDGEL